jgi:hypothetical protein
LEQRPIKMHLLQAKTINFQTIDGSLKYYAFLKQQSIKHTCLVTKSYQNTIATEQRH